MKRSIWRWFYDLPCQFSVLVTGTGRWCKIKIFLSTNQYDSWPTWSMMTLNRKMKQEICESIHFFTSRADIFPELFPKRELLLACVVYLLLNVLFCYEYYPTLSEYRIDKYLIVLIVSIKKNISYFCVLWQDHMTTWRQRWNHTSV